MARMVATKAALSIRVDALTDTDGKSEPSAPTIGMEHRAKLESRLRALEHQGDLSGIRSFADPSSSKKQKKFEMNADVKMYNTAADAVDLVATQRDKDFTPAERAVKAVLDVKEEKKRAKEERRRIRKEKAESALAVPETNGAATEVDSAAKGPDAEDLDLAKAERKRLKKEAKEAKKLMAGTDGDVKEKKKRKREEEQTGEEPSTEKKKKKRKE